MSLARLGKTPWNKGKKLPFTVWNKGTKGVVKPNSGSFKSGEHRSTDTEFKKGENKGSNNVMWKGDKVKYAGVHMWMVANYGNPSTCDFCRRDNLWGRSIDWANIDGKYTRTRETWLRLCKSCHKSYDLSKRQ